MSDEVFLRLYGENGSGERVVYEAWLDGSTIRTRICNRVTGEAEPAADAQRFFHRITLFNHETRAPLTTFDLLKDTAPVTLDAAGNRLRLRLRVRCFLMRPNGEDLVVFTGAIGIDSSGTVPRPAFRGLTAELGAFYDPNQASFGDFALTGMAGRSLDFNPRAPFTNLLTRALGISGQNHNPASLLRVSFEGHGTAGSGRVLLTFSLGIRINDSSAVLAFRRRSVEVRGDSTWTFFQRPPVGGEDDPAREREGPANRWTVLVDSGAGATTPDLLRIWNTDVAAPYLQGLRLIQGGRPLSIVPEFGEAEAVPVRVVYELREPDPQDRDLDPGDLRLPDDAPGGGGSAKVQVRVRSLQPGLLSRGAAASIVHGLRTWERAPLALPWRIVPPIPADQAPETAGEGLVLGAVHQGVAHQDPPPGEQGVRIGSLDFTFPPRAPEAPAETELRSVFRADFPREAADRPFIDIQARLTLAAVAPGGQDPLPEDEFVQDFPEHFERQPPVVISIGEPERRKLALLVEESTKPDRSQTLAMRLVDRDVQGTDAQGRGVVVIDRQPFLVAKVNVPRLQGSGEIQEIGNLSGGSPHGASWELSAGEGLARGFVLELPPQGVGEAMEKTNKPDADIDESEPADFRFTPPARFELQASFFEQRFAEAPWNLRRILGYPGQRAPGAGVRKLDFEMLYGLGCQVDAPFLRLAEIAARLGAIPGDVPKALPWPATDNQKKVHTAFRAAWADIFESYFSRLAVLEPWDDHQPDELTLEDGVRYQLRRNAHLRYPIPGASIPEGIPAEPGGLAGGVAWGFESANVYHATWRDPKSTSGKLARPYFSALGGWGFQKASFDKDRTTIYADTAMGRTFFLSLERIGRIGTLWNLAKHVIIYERTVAPSRQFFREQDPHAGRPVLRKVREFVEILQPQRSYPEFGAPAVTRGCVIGSEFKSRIINVNSAWGAEVGSIGWQVPLWRPGEDPVVYPKPQILFQAAADPEGGSPMVPLQIDEPEKLVFYTDTRETTDARTDLWPAVEGIDYLDLPTPRRPDIPGHAAVDLDRPLPPPPAVEPGFDRFTWAVLPAERGANLVVDRAEEALAAVLRNVTMMRSRPAAVLPRLLENVSRLGDPLEAYLQEALARLPARGQVTEEVLDRLAREIGAGEALRPLHDLRRTFDAIQADPLVQSIRQGTAAFCRDLQARSNSELDRLAGRISFHREAVRRELAGILRRLAQEREVLRAEAKRFVALRMDELRRTARMAQAGMDEISDRIARIEEDLGQAAGRIQGEIDKAVLLARDLERTASRELDRLRREVRDLRARIAALLREAESRLGGITEPRLARIAQTVREVLRTAGPRIDAALGEVERLLTGAAPDLVRARERLEQLARDVSGFLAFPTDAVRDARQALGDLANRVSTRLLATIDAAQTAVERRIDEILNAGGMDPEELARAIDAELGRVLQPVVNGLAALKTEIGGAIDRVCTQVLRGVQEILDDFGALLGAGGEAVARLVREALVRLKGQLGTGTVDMDAVRRAVEEEIARVRRQLEPLTGAVQQGLRKLEGIAAQAGDDVLRLLRAFGDAPIVPNLDFNRKQIAYFFDELKRAVDLTPVTALVNRLGDELKALGLRVPTSQLLDRVLPDSLENFDLSKIFPDFSGLKLDNLFPGLKMPALSNDKVKVTHGIDRQSRRAWMQAEVDVPIDKPSDLFVTGPVTVRLLKARFRAHARIEAGLEGPPRQTTRGEMTGDWQISVLNTPIVVFRDTALIFEDGKLRFDLSPDKVDFTEALRFLADLIKQVGYSEGGFSVRVLQDGRGLPLGVESVLDLPLPDLAAGAFSVTSLRLGSSFSLRVNPGPSGIDFELSTRFHLGTKRAPFALAISILTGGGWLDASARYLPRTGAVTTAVSIGIVAGGSLAFAFGPVRGGVYLFFGIEVEYLSATGRGGTLNIAILLLVRGEVQVLGFLTVGLLLLLQAQYQQDGRLVGSGTLSISIKVCRFFTVRVSTSVRYVFAKGSGPQAQALGSHREAAKAYIGMLH